jgi:hypothetical protein
MPEADLLAAIKAATFAASQASRLLERWRRDTLEYQAENRRHRLEHPEEGWGEDVDLWLPYDRPVTASQEEKIKAALAEATAAYLQAWQPGWKVLRGFMECDGRRPWGGEGPHLRRLVRIAVEDEIRPDRMPSARRSFEPELADGEELFESCGSLVPIIVLGRLPAAPLRDEEPHPTRWRDAWKDVYPGRVDP